MIAVYREKGKPLSDIILEIVAGMQKLFDAMAAVCGGCGAKGFLLFYCNYTRWVEYLEGGKPKSMELFLFRYKCSKCGKTHVIAPGELVIPYVWHTVGFILAVLEAYAKREKPVRQIAEDFQVAVSTIYEWAKRFKGQYDLMLGKLAASSGGIEKPLEDIIGKPDLSECLFSFANTNKFCFLQIRACVQRKKEGEEKPATRFFTLRGCLVAAPGAPP